MPSNRNSQTLLVGMQNDTVTLEDGLAVSNKAKHSFKPYDPAVELLSIYPTDLKISCPHKHLQVNVHSKFSPNCPKQPRCLSKGEWINWYIHTVEYYSVIKK